MERDMERDRVLRPGYGTGMERVWDGYGTGMERDCQCNQDVRRLGRYFRKGGATGTP